MKELLPIVVDIETSGIDKIKCGIWQIGAYDINKGEEFLEEARIDYEDEIHKEALKVTGKTEEELRDKGKQSQKRLLKRFLAWVEDKKVKNFLCQNSQFDVVFLEIKAMKYGLRIPFHYRSFDLHNIAQTRYHDLNGRFLIKDNHSDMGLTNILKFVGIPDNRTAHNSLEDCKLTAECFSRLISRENLFQEYSQFPIPSYLIKPKREFILR